MQAGNRPEPDTTPAPAIRDKRAIRARLRTQRRERRDHTSPAERATAARSLVAHLLQHPAFASATCIATFEPIATEEDVAVLREALGENIRCLVPITLDDLDLSWRDVATDADLGREAIAEADVVVTPALAIGPLGERLGQGGGCYDRALPRRTPGTPVIAVVFPEEYGVTFPVEPHDEFVDAVATREGLTVFPPSGQRAT